MAPAALACHGARSSATVPAPALAGSRWRLVQFVSMDDAQGRTRPADPSRYTLWLGADGRAVLRLDGLRATAPWSATASAEPANGSFRFGPLATMSAVGSTPGAQVPITTAQVPITAAQAPTANFSQRLARQLPYVRSYLLRNGHLHLALMADGGILEWEPLQPGS